MLSQLSPVILAASILSLPLIHAQFVSNLPQCVQNCIYQSTDDNCEVTDIKCLCRASAGNFLPDLITCMHGNCDDDLDNSLLLTPLQLACMLAGTPIPDSAIQNAENEASSLATQVTITVTKGGSGESTVTATTTQSGTTIYEIYPITVDSTTTITGPTSTKTISKTVDPGTNVIYTTTNSRGETVTLRPSSISSVTAGPSQSHLSSGSAGGNSDTTTTTSVAAQETRSSESSSKASKTSKAPSPDATDSAPFKDTNGAGARVGDGIERWLWIGALFATWWAWV
ncbi:uncharacterized protein PAC_11047 [Phialocephala subalpina]|uniref:CFEM domain-containing protein n=1 Tax=Phialocephala subalpina TaxID=576137 RepID=A0A1L7X813_9HELO|nr:uncharacterized protein PAC_11047 [Phialocephala subalpina]